MNPTLKADLRNRIKTVFLEGANKDAMFKTVDAFIGYHFTEKHEEIEFLINDIKKSGGYFKWREQMQK